MKNFLKRVLGWVVILGIALWILVDIFMGFFNTQGWHALWLTPLAVATIFLLVWVVGDFLDWAFKDEDYE